MKVFEMIGNLMNMPPHAEVLALGVHGDHIHLDEGHVFFIADGDEEEEDFFPQDGTVFISSYPYAEMG